MKTTDIIRGILDLIDGVDAVGDAGCGCGGECGCDSKEPTIAVATTNDDEMRRFKQILGLIDNEPTEYSNTPSERVSDIASVTTDAGGGVNEPKHADDIRGEHGRLYGGN